MANKTTSKDVAGLPGSSHRDLVIQHNNLVAKVEALYAKLDADAGVTDTNYGALLGANSSGEAKQIGDPTGTAITS